MGRFTSAKSPNLTEEQRDATPGRKRRVRHPSKFKSGQKITEQEWSEILGMFSRGIPATTIAIRVGRHERSIRRIFNVGLPGSKFGATPIRVLLDHEMAKARAGRERFEPPAIPRPVAPPVALEVGPPSPPAEDLPSPLAATSREREAAAKDTLGARTAEGQLVKLARGNVIALAGATVGLLGPMQELAKEIGETIKRSISGHKIVPQEGLRLIRDTVRTLKDLVDAGKKSMEMERLLLGDPTGGGRLAQEAAAMTDDDLQVEVDNMLIVFEKLHDSGLRIIQGGKAAEGAGDALDTSTSHTATSTPKEDDAAGAGDVATEDPVPEGEPT